MTSIITAALVGLIFAISPGPAKGVQLQPKITGQIRLDHETIKTSGAKSEELAGFNLNRARVLFEGGAKPLSYELVVNFDRNQFSDTGWTGSNDGVNRGLISAKIKVQLREMLELQFGRLTVNSLSMEGYRPSLDTYSVSQIILNRMPGSASGVALVATPGDQEFQLQVVNSPGHDRTGRSDFKVENDDLTVSLFWRGNLLGGRVQPILSFVNMTRRDYSYKTKITSDKYNGKLVGIGTAVKLTPQLVWEIEADYYSNLAYKADKTKAGTSGKTNTTTFVTSLGYEIFPKYLFAFAKYSNDREKFSDDPAKNDVSTSKYNAALEWRPDKDHSNVRYHASVENAAVKSGQDKTKTMAYLLGAAATI